MKKYTAKFFAFFMVQVLLVPGCIIAQICQGSLGDPVVHISFGSGSNPGPALSLTTTNYGFEPGDCPSDGNYTIRNSTSHCYGGAWFKLTEDHTPGDTNGYMMIIGASDEPGVFYSQTVNGLCENTTYEFAAWILNLLTSTDAITPNVTFTIETNSGTVLKTYQTGDILSSKKVEWKQYGLFFTTPTGVTSVVVKMTNNAPGGYGNDLALDDITFRPCGPLVTVTNSDNPGNMEVCSDDNRTFTLNAVISAGYTQPSLGWQISTDSGISWTDIPGSNTTSFLRTPTALPGLYQYRLAVSKQNNISCRILSDILSIRVYPLPVPAASNNGPFCEGQPLFLKASDGIGYSWTGPGQFTSHDPAPSLTLTKTGNGGKYYVQVTSDKGCMDVDSTLVVIWTTPTVNAGADSSVCEGKFIQLNGSGSDILSYNWSPSSSLSDPGIANPIASPAESTVYILTAINGSCKASDSVLILVDKKPSADAGPDQVMVQGQTVTLNGIAGGTNYSLWWTPETDLSLPTSLVTEAHPAANAVYTLHVQSNYGCGTATDTVNVFVYKDIYIPNAFSPNGDGLNDTWNVRSLTGFSKAEVKVFNRWGGQVYFNNGHAVNWDGNYKGVSQPAGVYGYIIDLKNGRNILRGTVTIIR